MGYCSMGRQSVILEAKRKKDDEFYTRYEDIDKAVQRYRDKFAGKCVYMPCDDPNWSNFWKYFHEHFTDLGLKRIICTFISLDNPHYALSYTGGNDADILQGERIPLDFDGDFYSGDALNFYAQCDIVCTNPPFSLFRKFIDVVSSFNIDFLVIGQSSACSYKNIFDLIMSKYIYISDVVKFTDGMLFVHDGLEKRVPAIWYTTFMTAGYSRTLTKSIAEINKKFICIDSTEYLCLDCLQDIPYDYSGLMLVPITIISCINNNQFDLVGMSMHVVHENKKLYTRFIVKLCNPSKRAVVVDPKQV